MKLIIKRVILLLLVCTLILVASVTQSSYHIEKCHDENCFICFMIEIAANIIRLLMCVLVFDFIHQLILYVLGKPKLIMSFEVQNTLVLQKVQFNE